MKKLWIMIALLCVCMTGCMGKATILSRPHSLQVVYGEESAFAMTGEYQWNWKDGKKTETAAVEAVDPLQMGRKLAYVVRGEGQTMELEFAVMPDKVLVEKFSAADGYAAGEYVEALNMQLPVPMDGQDYLYAVQAVWSEGKADSWGSCTYYFRFLMESEKAAASMGSSDTGDLDLAQLLQMDADSVLGIEFLNAAEGKTRICRNQKDRTAILEFLKENISEGMTPAAEYMPELTYALRLVTVGGSQLTVGYGAAGGKCCLQACGQVYECEPMDMAGLWAQMQAGPVMSEAAASGKSYLDMTEEFPGSQWGEDFVYAYVRELGEEVRYDEMRQVEDDEGTYRLEKGWSDQSRPLDENCEFWLLENHRGPYCKVTATTLQQWTENASQDVLYRIYTKENAVIAICQELVG